MLGIGHRNESVKCYRSRANSNNNTLSVSERSEFFDFCMCLMPKKVDINYVEFKEKRATQLLLIALLSIALQDVINSLGRCFSCVADSRSAG
jgi:hypothetical protein